MGGTGGFGRVATVLVAVVLVVLFGLGLVVHSILDHRRERVVRVFDLAKEYRLTLRQTNEGFSDRWNEYLNDSVDPYNGGNLDEQAYADLVTRFLQTDPNHDNYESLAGFYETLGDCVRYRLCDFWYARTTFGNDVVTFYHNMYPQIAVESQQGRNYDGIADFVDRMREADRGTSSPDWDDRMAAWAY